MCQVKEAQRHLALLKVEMAEQIQAFVATATGGSDDPRAPQVGECLVVKRACVGANAHFLPVAIGLQDPDLGEEDEGDEADAADSNDLIDVEAEEGEVEDDKEGTGGEDEDEDGID